MPIYALEIFQPAMLDCWRVYLATTNPQSDIAMEHGSGNSRQIIYFYGYYKFPWLCYQEVIRCVS